MASSRLIAASIAQWNNPFVERTVFGTDEPDLIMEQINAFCTKELGSRIQEILFYEASQGAVSGLLLTDGRRVVLKAHKPSRSLAFLNAVYLVQLHLAAHGFPCPKPLVAPAPLGFGHAIIEELIDEGSYTDAHIPTIRRIMAEKQAELIRLASDFDHIPGLDPHVLDKRLPPEQLFPEPHSNIFDFSTPGGEWIDRIAQEARQKLAQGVGRLVIGHTDYSVKHFRFTGEHVNVIYDWDSLALDLEPVIVGHTATTFPMTWYLDVKPMASREEALAFIKEYEDARGTPFTPAERNTLAAGATYGLAYGARCEHSLNPLGPTDVLGTEGPRAILKRYGNGFLL